MTPFLKQVADHYYNAGDIGSRCFIFPNRRAMVFFSRWLKDRVREACRDGNGGPLLAPQMYTVNDFFAKVSGCSTSDRIGLLLELYDVYKELNPKAEPLDEFIFWGDVILGDFNDVDKHLADPGQLFTNVSDFKAIQDTYSYLTDTQRSAIEGFVSHFSDRNGRLTVDLGSERKDVKARFLQIWNILYPMYVRYRERLAQKGMSYEGMMYRALADRLSDHPVDVIMDGCFSSDVSFVFIGLNALNECEKFLMRKLRDCGRAEFCWDWVGEMTRDRKNRASFFMSENYREFPPAFDVSWEGVGKASFNVLSVPSSYGQVKYLDGILDRLRYSQDEEMSGSETTVVLPDEGLLMPLLNSVPPRVNDINVTMGYPMSASRFYVLMSDIAAMQLHLRRKRNGWHYYHKQVWDVLSSGMLRSLMEGMEGCTGRVNDVRKTGKYYIPQEDLSGYPLLDMIFRPVVQDQTLADKEQVDALASYLQEVVAFVAPMMSSDPDMAIELEFARKYYNSINLLRTRCLAVKPATFLRLLDSLMEGVTVPFRGEPLKGLQIMGPLETRALDFRNVIIMSCNEGMFPRRNVSSSFIPPELRKAFGLPTYEYQDAIWAYYFYRLVCRAENVWMLYDSRTEGLKRGEESRYIKQLKYHFGVDVKFYVAGAGMISGADADDTMQKTDAMMEVIGDMSFSASALQNYVFCPMKFCYSSVLNLKKDEDVAESLDNAMIGNVYHNTMWAIYYGEEAVLSEEPLDKLDRQVSGGQEMVSREYLKSWLEREEAVKARVVSLMKAELKVDEVAGRDLVVQRVILRYVMETLRKDILLLERYGVDSFSIIGLEKRVNARIHGARFFGVIDRIDSLAPGMIRLSDYKSGADVSKVIAVTDADAEKVVQMIFDAPYKKRKEYKAALQFYIYDRMVREAGLADGGLLCNSMYSTSELFKEVPAVYPLSAVFDELMDGRLKGILDEIRDRNVPFCRTEETDACTYCDFRMICGR